MHRLLLPPNRRMEGVIRLPYVQDAHGRTTTQFQQSLMHTDALRRVKTTASNRIAVGPLSTPQVFITEPSGGSNTPESMAVGTPKMNARRIVNKTSGRTAGMI